MASFLNSAGDWWNGGGKTFAANTLSDLGYGLANSSNIGNALGVATNQTAQLQPARDLQAEQIAAKKQQAQQLQTAIANLRDKYQRPDLADAVAQGYDVDKAWQDVLTKKAHSYINAGDGKIFDETTGSYVDTGAAGGGSPPPFDGTGMDAQVGNILLRGDPNTADYAYAFSIASQPKITFQTDANGNQVPVYQTPDLSTVRKPTYRGNLPAPPAPTAAASPQMAPSQAGIAPQMPPIGNWGTQGNSALAAPGISVGSPLPGLGTKPNENQQRMGLLSNSLNTAAPEVLRGFDALSDPKQQILGIGGDLTKPWQSEAYQKATVALQSAISDIIPAISGAAFSENEIKEKINAFTPKFGEKPGTIAFKKQLFLSYVQGIANSSADPVAKQKAQEFLSGISTDAPAVNYKQKYGLD